MQALPGRVAGRVEPTCTPPRHIPSHRRTVSDGEGLSTARTELPFREVCLPGLRGQERFPVQCLPRRQMLEAETGAVRHLDPEGCLWPPFRHCAPHEDTCSSDRLSCNGETGCLVTRAKINRKWKEIPQLGQVDT
jgi:hypothetical protein